MKLHNEPDQNFLLFLFRLLLYVCPLVMINPAHAALTEQKCHIMFPEATMMADVSPGSPDSLSGDSIPMPLKANPSKYLHGNAALSSLSKQTTLDVGTATIGLDGSSSINSPALKNKEKGLRRSCSRLLKNQTVSVGETTEDLDHGANID